MEKFFFGCGVDEELINRFFPFITSSENPMPFVFSDEEFNYIQKLLPSGQAVAYAASFCLKESLFKACGFPFNFNETSFFYDEKNNVCTSLCNNDIFLDEGLIILRMDSKISIFDKEYCTARLILIAEHKER